MRGARVLATMLGFLLGLLPAGSPAEDARTIQGAWTVVSAERDGKPTTEVAGHRLACSGDTFTIQREGHTLYRGIYSADAGRKPATIDFFHTEGNLKGRAWKGIYRFEGEALRVCDNAPDMAKPRPTRFSTGPGSGYICIVFKRASG
jgi:uncharacterized protein (TIGR03067 family)